MLKEASALLPYITLSLALHTGSIAFLEFHYGATNDGRPPSASSSNYLRVVSLGSIPASRPPSSTGIGEDGSPQQANPLPDGIIALPGPYYFPPQELSRQPLVATPVSLEYPENAPGVTRNRVVLRLLINEEGEVDKIVVESTQVPLELEQLARKAFSQAKFQPGLRGEIAVKSQMLVEITFETESMPPPTPAMLPAR